MKIILMAAVANNHVIGGGGKLVWHLPADEAFFHNTIRDQVLIMGRKSWEAHKYPDFGKLNIVLTNRADYIVKNGVTAGTLEEGFKIASSDGADSVYVLGGGKVYELAMEYADELLITEIYRSFQGDTYFPVIDPEEWEEVWREDHEADEDNPYDFAFVRLQRKTR